MPLGLRDNLHWCDCAGRVVFLDVEADRYFCLPAPANAAFLRLAGGVMEAGDAEYLHSLIARGMLVDDPACRSLKYAKPLEPATCDFLPEPHPRARLAGVVGAFVSEIGAAWILRRKRFLQILEGAAKLKREPRLTPTDLVRSLRAIVSASSFVSLFTGTADRCLVRALSVHSLCRRLGLASRLVFGVRMDPFAAHCWVQFRGAVLVGDFEEVRLYTPILVVG